MATTEMTRSGGASASSAPPSGQGVSGEIAQDAGRLKDAAMNRARREADVRKNDAAKAAHSASSALDKAAEELKRDDGAPDWLASAFTSTASGIDRFASSVESRSPDEIGREVSRFARHSPAAFLAASAAAGFAAARFLRAGAEYQHHHPGGDGYGAGSTGQPASGSAFTGMSESRPGPAEGGTVL